MQPLSQEPQRGAGRTNCLIIAGLALGALSACAEMDEGKVETPLVDSGVRKRETSCSVSPDSVAVGDSYLIAATGLPKRSSISIEVTDASGTTTTDLNADVKGDASLPGVATEEGLGEVTIFWVKPNQRHAVATCSFDVHAPDSCGDGTCDAAQEDCSSCPEDCGVCPPSGNESFDAQVSSNADDTEESTSGRIDDSSSDLELGAGDSNAVVGLRFTNIAIPANATIETASIQFFADESQSVATNLTIVAAASDDAATLSTSDNDLSVRATTTASVNWVPDPWSSGDQGPAQRTPNLAPVIQEVVSRSGWVEGNDLVILITGTGHRTADSHDGSATNAARLHVQFSSGVCGDTLCRGNETTESCPTDCHCGDGLCDASETCSGCEADCGVRISAIRSLLPKPPAYQRHPNEESRGSRAARRNPQPATRG